MSALLGIGCITAPADAQDAAAPAQCPPEPVGEPTKQGTDPAVEEAIRTRVQSALHADPYFYDEHVTVTMEHGNVVLHGFVFSDWDLHDALKIAREAACHRGVIDLLSIKVGGRK
ncbi:MAG: BON domain-containing protein [Steroidobacterales bacterium]